MYLLKSQMNINWQKRMEEYYRREVRTIKDVFTIKNQTDSSADLFIYGDIINNTGWKWDDSDVMPDDVKIF